jgi:hypothetical protein
MAELKRIDTITLIITLGSSVEILTFYNSGYSAIVYAFIADSNGQLNYQPFNQGDLVITYTYSSSAPISVSLNNQGELIITSEDANNYSINGDGELENTVNI